MPRSVNHVASKARRKKILKLTRGYFGARKNVWTVAKNTWEKGLTYAFRDRKNKKRNFRALWIQRINAAARPTAFMVRPQNRNAIILPKNMPLSTLGFIRVTS